MNEEELRRERDRLRLLLEITNSMTSKLDLRRLVDVLSTNLLRVTRSDFCAMLLPNGDSGELRLTILYNPDSRRVHMRRNEHTAPWFDLWQSFSDRQASTL